MPQADPQAARQTPLDNEPDARPAGSTGFGRLAAQISSWTTRCLLSAIVLLVGLLFGLQVLRWWREDPSQQTVLLPEATRNDSRLTDPAVTHFFGFGDSTWSLARRSLSGSRLEATRELKALCVELTPTAGLPPGEIGPEERRLLDRIARMPPAAEEQGKWQVYAIDGPYPMAAGTRPAGGEQTTSARNQVAAEGSRVVTWVVAVPSAETEWTLYAFHSPAPSNGPLPGLSEIPLPPESARLLSMRAESGGAIVAFKGAAQTNGCKKFYDRWFLARGWSAAGPWRASGGGWHQQYGGPGGPRAGSVEIRLGPDGQGGMNGLVFVNPPSTTDAKSETP
jgi:hypothetical protein